jgi:DNA replication protein DnaD
LLARCGGAHLGSRGRQIFEFEAGLVYRVSSRTTRATQRNLVLRNKNKQTNKQKTKTNKNKRKKKEEFVNYFCIMCMQFMQ